MFPYNTFARKLIPLSRLPLFTLFAVLMLALCFGLIVNAAAGDLDTSFSTDGWHTTDFFGDYDSTRDVALQRDGKIVVAGFATRNGHLDFALARYLSNGTPDTTFSGDGKLTIDFRGEDVGQGVALQSDGKIVVAGYSTNNAGQIDFALARYNTNGTPDTTFSGDGKVKTDFFGGIDLAFSVAIQTNGRIVVVGRAETAPGSNNYDFAVARYNTNGTPDTTFDTDGQVTTEFFGLHDYALAVRIAQGGKILVAGRTRISTSNRLVDFALARYNANGSLDTTFSGDGKQNTDFGRSTDIGQAVVIQPDQKIVVVGYALTFPNSGPSYKFALARYNSDGTPDTTFSGDGKQITTFPGGIPIAIIEDVVLQRDGKIVAVGNTCDDNFVCDLALARYNTNGLLDTSFSGDGKLTADLGGDENGYAGALQTNGRLIVAGSMGPFDTDPDLDLTQYNFLVARFLGDGAALATPSESDSQIPGVSVESHQISVAPAPARHTNNFLNTNPGAKKSAAKKHFEGLLGDED